MRLLTITTSYPRFEGDDSSVFVKRLCHALRDYLDSLDVLVPHDSLHSSVEVEDRLTVRRIRFWPIVTSLTFGAGLLENIRQKPLRALLLPALVLTLAARAIQLRDKFDVIHANWIISGAAALLVKIVTGKKYVLTLRGSEMLLIKNPLVRVLFLPILLGAKVVTTVSESLRRDLVSYFPSLAPKTRTVPNGVEHHQSSQDAIQGFSRRFNLSDQVDYYLSVGSVIPRKQIDKLIELMAHPTMASSHLLICGKLEHREYHQQLERLAAELAVVSRIHFLGAIAPNEVGCAFSISKALLAASSFEGRPNAVLEAMAAGLPVIASDIPAHLEIVQDGVNGAIVNFANPNETAKKISMLISDEPRTAEIIRVAKQRVGGHDWSDCAKMYMELFKA